MPDPRSIAQPPVVGPSVSRSACPWFVGLGFAWASLGALWATNPVLTLPRMAEVSGDGIYLSQVVSTVPPVDLPHVRVAAAPPFGQVAMLSRAHVNAWLRQHAPDLDPTQWVGADRVRVTRRSRSMDEIEIRERLRTLVQDEYVKERGELDLRLSRPWSSLPVPDEGVTLQIVDLPATGPGTSFFIRFELWSGSERLGNWQVAASARIWREIPVAQVPLLRGQTLADAAVILERRDVLALRGAPGVFDPGDPSLELVENIAAGQPILARSVRPRPVIRRGQLVEAVMESGALSITLKVEALQDGLPGENIRVRNQLTRRELAGKVLNEQTILIPH
ncbi:MAG: flagellar basal body P-ring formation protein FlgA [Verrucomicrobiae bacterium]|nr:flagellar basal body P-ring formation protein FlgA [Verrucomicrobiae bacterium]